MTKYDTPSGQPGRNHPKCCTECGIHKDQPETLKHIHGMIPCGDCGKPYQSVCRTCGKSCGGLICRVQCHYDEYGTEEPGYDENKRQYLGDVHCLDHLVYCHDCKSQSCTHHAKHHTRRNPDGTYGPCPAKRQTPMIVHLAKTDPAFLREAIMQEVPNVEKPAPMVQTA